MDKSERPVLVAVFLAMVALISLAAVVPDARRCPPGTRCPAAGAPPRRVSSTSGLSATAHTDTSPGGSGTTRRRPAGRARQPCRHRHPPGRCRTARRASSATAGSWSPTTAPPRPARSASWARPAPTRCSAGVHRAAAAVRPQAPAGAGRLRADRHHRGPLRRPGPRLLPRHRRAPRCRSTSTPRTATTRCCCSTSSPAAPTSSPSPSAGPGRSRTRTSASRSTRSGGWASTASRAPGSARSAPSEVNRVSAWLRDLVARNALPAEAVRAAPVPHRHDRPHRRASSRAAGW